MVVRAARRVAGGRAEHEVAAGHRGQHPGEVLRPRLRMRHALVAVVAEDLGDHLPGELRVRRVVHGRRVLVVVLHRRFRAVGRGDLRTQPRRLRADTVPGPRGEGPYRRVEVRGVRDDVAPGAGVEGTDGHHHRVEDVEAPGDHRLERGHHGGRRGHRVAPVVRRGAVAAPAVHGHLEPVAGGHQRAGPGPEGPPRVLRRHHVHAVRRVGPPAGGVEHALVDHQAGAVPALLTGLEHEDHITAQRLPVLHQQPRGPHQHGHVQIVAAGVHRPVDLAGEGDPARLCHRQRVHVSPQQYGGPCGIRSSQDRGHRTQRLSGGDLQTEAVEFAQQRLLGPRKFQTDLRMSVQPLPQGRELWRKLGRSRAKGLLRSHVRTCL